MRWPGFPIKEALARAGSLVRQYRACLENEDFKPFKHDKLLEQIGKRSLPEYVENEDFSGSTRLRDNRESLWGDPVQRPGVRKRQSILGRRNHWKRLANAATAPAVEDGMEEDEVVAEYGIMDWRYSQQLSARAAWWTRRPGGKRLRGKFSPGDGAQRPHRWRQRRQLVDRLASGG